jgi:flagellar export protein FliJ
MPRDQLKLVQDLAERQEREAGERLFKAQSQVDAAQGQLNQVMDYRSDYYRLATGAGGDLINTARLQTARHFLSQLDTILGRQLKSVEQAELVLAQQTAAWVETRRRLNAIKNLRATRGKERDKHEDKRTQRWLDELYAVQTFYSEAR